MITDTDRLNWLAAQIKPGCFFTLSHHTNPSQFYGTPPKGWSAETPISVDEFPEHFGKTLRDAIDSALANNVIGKTHENIMK